HRRRGARNRAPRRRAGRRHKPDQRCAKGFVVETRSKVTQRRKDAKAQRRTLKLAKAPLSENQISKVIVDSAIDVHRELGGPGLLESVYEEALVFELVERGLEVDRQKAVPVFYKQRRLATDLRLDLLVGEKVVVECKATTLYSAVFEAQVLTYLRLLDLKLGMVINFGERKVSRGIHRVVNGLDEVQTPYE
ncbi:MAG TPA: GxxExxY protein, partial [Candidatus Sulfomarinibacteraceae bacterium]|nr:GxxExxY protein [Candidatus Sulfomarinibacteraceae bacterium]